MLKIHVSYGNKILHRLPAPSLPNHVQSLCDSSNFNDKISLIQSAFPDNALIPVKVDSPRVNSLLASVTSANAGDTNKSCDLDPLPTTLLKACLDTLLYPIRIL